MQSFIFKLDQAKRLDVVLSKHASISRSECLSLIKSGKVKVNKEIVSKASTKLFKGDVVQFEEAETKQEPVFNPSSIELEIVFEDEAVIVLNKPPGVVVHPGAGREKDSLVHSLVTYLGEEILEVGQRDRPTIVHRLDKDTSGLMVIAKTVKAYQHLSEQFVPPREISRNYYAFAFCAPILGSKQGTIDLALGRSLSDRRKYVDASEGKPSITHWKEFRVLKHAIIFDVMLETGRTHQIRAHFAACGANLIGDKLYGGTLKCLPHSIRKQVEMFPRQALHAHYLSFMHPLSNERLEFKLPLPLDLLALENLLDAN